jgi:tetratricopeptide (TPR) repeat protein
VVLDEALAAVRVDHPHLARMLEAGIDEHGVPFLARDDGEAPFHSPSSWSDYRDRVRELLGALGALDAAGQAHGRVHRGNLRLRAGRALLVDARGTGDPSEDLAALALAVGEVPPDAPEGAEGWRHSLALGSFSRSVDAARALAAIDPGVPSTLPERPPVGLGLLAVRPPPMRGREQERERLDQAIAEGRERATLVVVSSAQGMGSSRLLEAAGRRAHARGHHTTFRGHSLEQLVPASHGTLRHVLAHAEGSDVGRYAKLRKLLVQQARGRVPLVILEDAHLHPQHLPFARAWLARGQPGVLLVDLDDSALQRPAVARILEQLQAEGAVHLPLGPIAEDALVDSLTSLAPDVEELARSAAVLASGNPMAAHHALLSLVATREVPLDTSPWWSWMELVLVHPDDRRHLEIAAILDQPIDPVEWARAGTSLGLRWSKQLPYVLRLHGLAQRKRGRWRLAHSDLRATLRQRCREEGRWEEVHRACAAAVRGPRAAERRGKHLLEAADAEGAAEALLASVDRVEKAGEVELAEVLGLLGQALQHAPADDPRRVRMGLAQLRLAQGDEAVQLGKQVARHGTTEDRFRVAVHMVGTLGDSSQEEQDMWTARAFALARKLGRDEATGLAWQGLAGIRLARGDLDGAERALAKAHALLDDAEAEVFRAELLATLGRDDEAQRLLEQVDTDNDALASRIQAAWGHAAFRRDEWPRALLHYRASEELAERAGLPSAEPSWHVGKTLVQLGRHDEARQRFQGLLGAPGASRCAAHIGLLALDAVVGDRDAVESHLTWLTDHTGALPDPAATRLLDDAAAQLDSGAADRVRALARRSGGPG